MRRAGRRCTAQPSGVSGRSSCETSSRSARQHRRKMKSVTSCRCARGLCVAYAWLCSQPVALRCCEAAHSHSVVSQARYTGAHGAAQHLRHERERRGAADRSQGRVRRHTTGQAVHRHSAVSSRLGRRVPGRAAPQSAEPRSAQAAVQPQPSGSASASVLSGGLVLRRVWCVRFGAGISGSWFCATSAMTARARPPHGSCKVCR